jgi:hypothetical protein
LEAPRTRKEKGDLAELKVACDLIERGYQIALPYGEDWDFDLILLRDGLLKRVQIKYSASKKDHRLACNLRQDDRPLFLR